jgi:hypothetical protein
VSNLSAATQWLLIKLHAERRAVELLKESGLEPHPPAKAAATAPEHPIPPNPPETSSGGAALQPRCPTPGRPGPAKARRTTRPCSRSSSLLAIVRYVAHRGLKSDIQPLPASANSGRSPPFSDKFLRFPSHAGVRMGDRRCRSHVFRIRGSRESSL